MKYLISLLKAWWPLLLYLLVYFIVINVVVLNRFWQFEAYYFDHGIYDSSLWQAAHGQMPYVDLINYYPGGGLVRQLGNHFTPTFYLLTPIYWFTAAYEPVLIVQNLIVWLSVIVIFFIAKDKIISRLMVGAIVFAYTLFIGLQNLLIANLHADAIATLTLALCFWALEKKKWFIFGLFLLLTLGAKENFASIGVALGTYLLIQRKVKIGLIAIVGSLVYYLLTIKIFIPVLGQQKYIFDNNYYPPLEAIKQIFYPWIKSQTIFVSLMTFGLLPIFSLSYLLVIAQDFFTRFVLNSGSARWDLGLHYNATLSVILTYGAILGVTYLAKKSWYRKIISGHALVIILTAIIIHRFLYHGPLGLAYNPDFYSHTKDLNFLHEFIGKIPTKKVVMTQNNLASYLTHTDTVLMLRGDYQKFAPDIIAIDKRAGQNPNNYWPLTSSNFSNLVLAVSLDPNYRLFYNDGNQLIYERINLANNK